MVLLIFIYNKLVKGKTSMITIDYHNYNNLNSPIS